MFLERIERLVVYYSVDPTRELLFGVKAVEVLKCLNELLLHHIECLVTVLNDARGVANQPMLVARNDFAIGFLVMFTNIAHQFLVSQGRNVSHVQALYPTTPIDATFFQLQKAALIDKMDLL